MMFIRWFMSGTVRQALEFRKQVLKMMRAQMDILSPDAKTAIVAATDSLHTSVKNGENKARLMEEIANLEKTANKWLIPYPNAGWRENVEVFLVAVSIALAIRTFFVQPMKIPTGSMQPTLYGITDQVIPMDKPNAIPSFFQRCWDFWGCGTAYYTAKAQCDGELLNVEPPQSVFPFIKKQRFLIGGQWHSIWFVPENLPDRGEPPEWRLFTHSGSMRGQVFKKGDDVIKLKVVAGDHLFVDRMTYNFRPPERGDIVIFETHGIQGIRQQDTYYIKRLVGLSGETIQIGDDQHLIINGQRLGANTRYFENVYTFPSSPKENQYFGHVNQKVGAKFGRPDMAFLFPDEQTIFNIRSNHFMVMGDNTMNSLDSRYWGDFEREKVIGKSCFVYWPISSRFGWSHR